MDNYSINISVKKKSNISSETAETVIFPFSHYKSMGTISCHSNQSSYPTGITNKTFVEANVLSMYAKFQLRHRKSWVLPVLLGSKVSCSRTQYGGGRFRTPRPLTQEFDTLPLSHHAPSVEECRLVVKYRCTATVCTTYNETSSPLWFLRRRFLNIFTKIDPFCRADNQSNSPIWTKVV